MIRSLMKKTVICYSYKQCCGNLEFNSRTINYNPVLCDFYCFPQIAGVMTHYFLSHDAVWLQTTPITQQNSFIN